MGSVWAVVVAGGQGTRFGRPKQFEEIMGRRVIDWSVAAAARVADGVVVVVPEVHTTGEYPGASVVVAGGAKRSGSVRAGLAAVPMDCSVIVVHDAARPAASEGLFARVIAPLLSVGSQDHPGTVEPGYTGEAVSAVIPVIQVTDTLKRVHSGVVVETLERESLVYVQTPQAFDAEMLRKAHESEAEATDDSALVENCGGTVMVVPGEPENIKITEARDIGLVAQTLESHASVDRRPV